MPWRRLVTIPGYVAAGLAVGLGAPLWLPLLALVDLVRRRRAVGLRGAAFLVVYLGSELVGLALLGGLWVWRGLGRIDSERWVDLHFGLESWWGATLYRAMVRCFSLDVVVTGQAHLARGPYLLFVRHSSAGDTLLAAALVSRPHRIRLRYVIKREHLWDPCLDVAGHRAHNVFVDRSAGDSEREIGRIRELARGLGARDAVLIYPEGTRFSEHKRERLLERLRAEGETAKHDYARSLRTVLPPRIGGPLALLEGAPDADVVIAAQTGFEGTTTIGDLWSGRLVGQRIQVDFRRIPRDALPTSREGRAEWLHEEWRRVDDWVATRLGSGS